MRKNKDSIHHNTKYERLLAKIEKELLPSKTKQSQTDKLNLGSVNINSASCNRNVNRANVHKSGICNRNRSSGTYTYKNTKKLVNRNKQNMNLSTEQSVDKSINASITLPDKLFPPRSLSANSSDLNNLGEIHSLTPIQSNCSNSMELSHRCEEKINLLARPISPYTFKSHKNKLNIVSIDCLL